MLHLHQCNFCSKHTMCRNQACITVALQHPLASCIIGICLMPASIQHLWMQVAKNMPDHYSLHASCQSRTNGMVIVKILALFVQNSCQTVQQKSAMMTTLFPCRCACCQGRGATIGCRLDSCPHSFHRPCAKQAGCTFYPQQYLIACKDHAHLYTSDAAPVDM